MLSDRLHRVPCLENAVRRLPPPTDWWQKVRWHPLTSFTIWQHPDPDGLTVFTLVFSDVLPSA
ncbi:MAG: hypothetical protein OWS74_00455, partial [Firmicutes bacterium]|nr:hypothetical protein [Bacillota bacterium]